MNKELLKKLLSQTTQGKFNSVRDIIISQQLKLSGTEAAKIIVECCRILTLNKEKHPVCEEELYKLLKTCSKFIEVIPDEVSLHYFQSLFFITKFMLEQNRYDIVIKMEILLIPRFMVSITFSKISKVHISICNLIYNAICNSISKRIGCPITHLYSLLLKMKSFHITKSELLKRDAYTYFRTSQFMNATLDMQCECYESVLQCVLDKPTNEAEDKNISEAVIIIINVITTNLLKADAVEKVKQYIKIGILIISRFYKGKKYLRLIEILQCSLIFVTKLEGEEDWNLLTINLKKCLNILKKLPKPDSNSNEICSLLLNILLNFMERYKKDSNICLAKETHLTFSKLLGEIGQISSQHKANCNLCSDCNMKINISVTVQATTLIGNVLSISIEREKDISESLCKMALNYFDYCCKMIIKIQQGNCTGWKYWWKVVGVAIYNISVKLYYLKHTESCNYWTFLIRKTIYFESSLKSSVFQPDTISLGLTCLYQIYKDKHQFKEALMYAAILIMLRSDLNETCFEPWIALKSTIKQQTTTTDLALLRLTSICILKQNRDVILDFCSDLEFHLDNMNVVNILMLELQHYKSKWPSKITMVCTLRKLYDTADILVTTEMLIKIWGNNVEFANQELFELLPEIRIKFEAYIENVCSREKQIKHQLYLAFIYALQYYLEVMIARQKIADDIVNTFTAPSQSEATDKNDECDIISAYTDLNLNCHRNITELLNKAVSIFSTCISDTAPKYIVEILEELRVFEFIANIAYEFRVHCNSLQETYTWLICLRISRLTTNKLHTLKSISFLLEKSSTSWDGSKELLKEADALSVELSNLPDSEEILEALTMYHIKKSKMFLYHGDYQTGFSEYEKAVMFSSKLPNEKELLLIQLKFLHVQYLQLPCDLQIDHHNNYLTKFSAILKDIISYLKNKVSDRLSIVMSTLFEVNQFIVNTYTWMCLPREVRCCSREIVIFAQRQILPLRVVYLLTSLANADLQSSRLDDCKVKLDGISYILCLEDRSIEYVKSSLQRNDDTAPEIIEEIEDLTMSFAEVMLECPAYENRALSGSPTLYEKSLQVPIFIKHSTGCDCFYCTSVEYMELILTFLQLKAQLNVHLECFTNAKVCFKAALNVHKQIVTRSKIFKTLIIKYLSCYPFADLETMLWQAHCAILLDYGNSFIKRNNMLTAQNVNKILVDIMSSKKYKNAFLYNEAFYQKLVIEMNLQDDTNRNCETCTKSSKEMSVEEDKELLKTPNNKLIKIIYSPSGSNTFKHFSYVKRRPNPIKFSPSHSDNDESDNCNKISSPTKGNEDSKNNCLLTETFCKTPTHLMKALTPSCLKIIVQSKVLSENINFTEMKEKDTSSEENEVTKKEDISLAKNKTTLIDSSPDVHTPHSIKVAQTLQMRTRLLTRKLQNPTPRTPLTENNINKKKENNNNNRRKVHTNLRSKFCAADDNTENVNKKKK